MPSKSFRFGKDPQGSPIFWDRNVSCRCRQQLLSISMKLTQQRSRWTINFYYIDR